VPAHVAETVALAPGQIVTGGVTVAAMLPTVTVPVAEAGQVSVPVAADVTVYVVVTLGDTTIDDEVDPPGLHE
jgi:hypothetical protein